MDSPFWPQPPPSPEHCHRVRNGEFVPKEGKCVTNHSLPEQSRDGQNQVCPLYKEEAQWSMGWDEVWALSPRKLGLLWISLRSPHRENNSSENRQSRTRFSWPVKGKFTAEAPDLLRLQIILKVSKTSWGRGCQAGASLPGPCRQGTVPTPRRVGWSWLKASRQLLFPF